MKTEIEIKKRIEDIKAKKLTYEETIPMHAWIAALNWVVD